MEVDSKSNPVLFLWICEDLETKLRRQASNNCGPRSVINWDFLATATERVLTRYKENYRPFSLSEQLLTAFAKRDFAKAKSRKTENGEGVRVANGEG